MGLPLPAEIENLTHALFAAEKEPASQARKLRSLLVELFSVSGLMCFDSASRAAA
jgi:hypothetical protein